MQQMLGFDKNKRMLLAVSIGSLVIAVLGLYIFLFGSPKQVFLSVMDNFNNKGLELVTSNLSTIQLYNQDYVIDADIQYNIDKSAINSEDTPILSNDMNVLFNKSKNNSHDVIKVTLPNGEESKEYNVYYQNGALILDVAQYDTLVKLNKDILGNFGPDSVDLFVDMYKRWYKQFASQLNSSDFYKITVNDDVGNGVESVQKYGITLSDERLNEVLVNTAKGLTSDTEFIELYISYQKMVDINSAINEGEVINILNSWAQDLQAKEIKENTVYELLIATSGIFNEKISKIEFFKLDNREIINSVEVVFVGDNANIKVQNKDIIYDVNVTKNEYGYSMNVTSDKTRLNIVFENFEVSKNIKIEGTIEEKDVDFKYSMELSRDNKKIDNELYIDLKDGQTSLIHVDIKSQTEFKTIAQYIETKRLYTIDEVPDEVKQYVEQFNLEVIDKLGIAI